MPPDVNKDNNMMNENPLWFKETIFYEVYVRAFFDSNADGHGDLPGLTQKLDYLQDLGVGCIWLLPIYPSPLKDDGYDIADYYGILDEYGTREQFKTLLDEAHRRQIRVITDLVLNHTSDQHPWFQAARTSRSSPYRDYYVWSDTKDGFSDARVIFVDSEPSNWTWDAEAGQFFWHRFYSSQPDLNFDNPAVREAMFDVMDFWLELGVDGFRADAVPYLFEREGTNCENLPETHKYLRELRSRLDARHPGKILLCEANQWPEDVRPYFGEGDEFHLGFHFPVMPRLYMALKKEDAAPIRWIMDRTPAIPEGCQWAVFLRNHDELTLEMVTEDERQWMWQEYAPETRMRLNLGIRRRLAPLLDNDRRKIELLNSLLFTLPGSPVIYYGDEIGMGDDIWLHDRNGVRTPMQWNDRDGGGFSQAPLDDHYAPSVSTPEFAPAKVNVEKQMADPGSLYHTIKKLIAVRKAHPIFGWGDLKWVEPGDSAVLAYTRSTRAGSILCIHNLSGRGVVCQMPHTLPLVGEDLIDGGVIKLRQLTLAPYKYLWVKI